MAGDVESTRTLEGALVATVLYTSAEVSQYRYGWIDAYLDPVPGDARKLTFTWDPPDSGTGRGPAGHVLAWRVKEAQGENESEFLPANRKQITLADTTDLGNDYVSYSVSGLLPDTLDVGRLSAYSAHGSAATPDGDVRTRVKRAYHLED